MASGVQQGWEQCCSLIQGWEIQTRCSEMCKGHRQEMSTTLVAPAELLDPSWLPDYYFFPRRIPKQRGFPRVLAVVLALLKVM